MVGYQYRTRVAEENLTHPHCSVLQYNITFPFNTNKIIGSFVDTGISIVGVNQSILQPNIQLTVGFQFASSFRFGTGPTLALRGSQDPPFFPQLLMEGTFLLDVEDVRIPIKVSYVPLSQNLEQYQLLVGYSFVFK